MTVISSAVDLWPPGPPQYFNANGDRIDAINTSIPGSYRVRYYVTDRHLKTNWAIRGVTVAEPPPSREWVHYDIGRVKDIALQNDGTLLVVEKSTAQFGRVLRDTGSALEDVTFNLPRNAESIHVSNDNVPWVVLDDGTFWVGRFGISPEHWEQYVGGHVADVAVLSDGSVWEIERSAAQRGRIFSENGNGWNEMTYNLPLAAQSLHINNTDHPWVVLENGTFWSFVGGSTPWIQYGSRQKIDVASDALNLPWIEFN